MCREVGCVIAEPAEIDDLGDARSLGLGHDVLGHPAIELEKAARAERVDEVIGDVDALERPTRRFAVGEVGGDAADSGKPGAVARRDCDDLTPLRERRNQRAADEPGGSRRRFSQRLLATLNERRDPRRFGDRVAGQGEGVAALQRAVCGGGAAEREPMPAGERLQLRQDRQHALAVDGGQDHEARIELAATSSTVSIGESVPR